MLYRVRYRHFPMDQIARTYWSDARSVLKLADRLVSEQEAEVMIESEDGGVWTPEQFRVVAGSA